MSLPTAAPAGRRRLPPGHTEWDMLELEARRGVHMGMLPSVRNRPGLDGLTGAATADEASTRGWTAQQPWVHVECDVLHLCIMCGGVVDPDLLRQHRCAVLAELEH